MKKKILLIGLFSLIVGTTAVAQRQQISKDYVHYGFKDDLFGIIMHGKMTYSYVANEIGQIVKDGPLSINCNINDKFLVKHHLVVGRATVKATNSKGNLNGAINANYKASVTGYKVNAAITASMRGNFTNGVPNGNFVVNRNTSFVESRLNANYKNGILVGPFSVSLKEYLEESELSGTISQNGKFIGLWNLNGIKATFQNGVLVSESSYNYATRAALVELSKKYAAGTISKEKLAEKNIFIKTKTLGLGDLARKAILRYSGIDFEKIGGYDFSISNDFTYEYLYELAHLTDTGVQLLAQQMVKNPEDVSLDYDEEYGLYYIYMHENIQTKYINPQYVTGTFRNTNPRVYISPKQKELLDEAADKYYVENPNKLINIISQYARSKEYNSETINFLNFLQGWEDGEFLDFLNLEDHIKIQNDINEMYQTFLKESTPHKNNENVILWKVEESPKVSYISKSSIVYFETVVKEWNNKVKKAQEEKAKEEEAIIKKPFDFLVKNRSASSIAYDSEFENFFTYDNKGIEWWRLEATRILKPFCKIVGYEIIKIIDTKLGGKKIIKCRLLKKGKKGTKLIHELDVEFNTYSGTLKLESFDINKAKLIEN